MAAPVNDVVGAGMTMLSSVSVCKFRYIKLQQVEDELLITGRVWVPYWQQLSSRMEPLSSRTSFKG